MSPSSRASSEPRTPRSSSVSPRPEQVTENLTAVGTPLTDDELAFVRDTLGRLQQNLDAHSEVFLDEKEAGR
ncbi:hypothetical protein AB0A05_37790 [Streptomyces sp. NPDC046374]|uniref:hypothetical protein n=1 Tax=Streptomyces sp. NPDC046374 TaxID=3154917 RepID=UPI0033DE44B8